MNKEFISLEGVSKQYVSDTNSGVRDISLNIGRGKIVAIVGESGSGKSTLLKLIYGLLSPDTGRVLFNGEPVLGPGEKLIPGHDRMKMVTQDFSLNTYAKVYDNIASMLSNSDLKRKDSETRRMMELLRISHLFDKRAVDLSGGEQQRVAIARAMVTHPDVLLLDEPFSQIDTTLKNRLRSDIRKINEEDGTTIIVVSHDPVDGLSLADDLVIVREGRIVETGAVKDIYYKPSASYTAELLAEANIVGKEHQEFLGIGELPGEAAIYPEWIVTTENPDAIGMHIKDIIFRGAFDDIILERNGLLLKMHARRPHKHAIGEQVRILILERILF